MLVMTDDIGQVLDQRSPVGHAEQLHAATDAEGRQVTLVRCVEDGQLRVVPVRAQRF